jgi:hypothetical protein
MTTHPLATAMTREILSSLAKSLRKQLAADGVVIGHEIMRVKIASALGFDAPARLLASAHPVQPAQQAPAEDSNLAEEIAEECGGYWCEHPNYPASDWRWAVDEGETRAGYWEWVVAQIALQDNAPDQEETTPAPLTAEGACPSIVQTMDDDRYEVIARSRIDAEGPAEAVSTFFRHVTASKSVIVEVRDRESQAASVAMILGDGPATISGRYEIATGYTYGGDSPTAAACQHIALLASHQSWCLAATDTATGRTFEVDGTTLEVTETHPGTGDLWHT